MQNPASHVVRLTATIVAPPDARRLLRRFTHMSRIDGLHGSYGRPCGCLWRQAVASVLAHRRVPWVWI